MIVSNPGQHLWYPSIGPERWNGSFEGCSRKSVWCVELGYPNIDVQQWNDGEQAIIEFYNTPLIPSMTRWNYILTGLRNIDVTPGFLTKYVQQLDLHKRQVWDIAEAKTKKMEDEKVALEAHAQDTAERAKNIIMGNPALVERIAKNGLQEINLSNMIKHVPRHQLIGHISKPLPKKDTHERLCDASQPANETVHPGTPSEST